MSDDSELIEGLSRCLQDESHLNAQQRAQSWFYRISRQAKEEMLGELLTYGGDGAGRHFFYSRLRQFAEQRGLTIPNEEGK